MKDFLLDLPEGKNLSSVSIVSKASIFSPIIQKAVSLLLFHGADDGLLVNGEPMMQLISKMTGEGLIESSPLFLNVASNLLAMLQESEETVEDVNFEIDTAGSSYKFIINIKTTEGTESSVLYNV